MLLDLVFLIFRQLDRRESGRIRVGDGAIVFGKREESQR
jgi:hypothetical protein